jgi:class 3 adenylate cyclase
MAGSTRLVAARTGIALALVLALPLVGLFVLLAAPSVDGHWQHRPSHFWLVLATATVAAALGWSVGASARRRADARLFLVALSFVAAASFLGLHALATPRVLLEGSNAGFTVATPVGLLLAAALASWSSLRLDGSPARWVMERTTGLRAGLVALVAGWAAWSVAELPPLDASPPEDGSAFMVGLAIPGLALFALAAARYLPFALRRRSMLLLAMAAAWVLLAEAEVAVALSHSWRASWWEWHLLMTGAFAVIAITARRLPETERFSDLYLDEVMGGTREVTVLFADLEGFTAFSESHEPEGVQAMLNAYFEVVLPEIRAHGGRLDRFIGDAVMVTFNVADGQRDHAARGSRAAVGFQRAASALAEAHPEWPRFRVGVHTGVAVAGVVGDRGERDYTVLGDTVNVASRIESMAPVGGVAISDATRRAVPGARVVSLGSADLKGRSTPVEIWLLTAVEARDSASRDPV